MPTIAEEAEEHTQPDFLQLLDIETDPIGTTDNVARLSINYGQPPTTCPAHGTEDCLCHGFLGDCTVTEAAPAPIPASAPAAGVDEPDYSRFEDWIPRFCWPERPCDYCRTRRLNCFMSRGQASCNACASLFRECSFANTRTLEAFNQVDNGTSDLLDTLHSVDEDTVRDQGTMTGIKPLASKRGALSGTSTPPIRDDAPGSSKRNGIRFPRHAVKILRDWLDSHADHPYPSEQEKAELEQRTELKPSQIANWLANARRRRKVTDRSRPKVCSSPSLNPTTPAIAIPTGAEKPWEELNPMERWKHSPPENEPATINDIAQAVANSDLPEDAVSRSPSSGRRKKSSAGSGFSSFRAPSTTSLDTSGQSSSISSTAISHGSSQSHGRRRRTAAPTKPSTTDDKKRIFQCTFCTDTFKSKYDWTRHEKSLHLSLEKWVCAPLGPVVVDAETNRRKCVYCEELDPDDDHLESHNHHQCEEKGIDARTFYRKDHLRQHLRLMHGCAMSPAMEKWKFTAVKINSRCGFCGQRFSVWQERVDHLTAHFKAGARMKEWKGCRGLDPAVAAQVTNAMPPYLIGIEAVSAIPFSATNRATWDQTSPDDHVCPTSTRKASEEGNGLESKATCWEILTVRLGKYANEMSHKGVVLTDEMLQRQARKLLYEDDDAWNQTAADNPEWLDLFKKAHGLDYIPSTIGGSGQQIPEDLETYGDLGLRIPFTVQLQAYNECLSDAGEARGAAGPAAARGGGYDLSEGYVDKGYLKKLADERTKSGRASAMTQSQCASGCDCQNRSNFQDTEYFGKEGVHAAHCSHRPQSRQQNEEYLRRHKMELPVDRARRFATTTPAWSDSGVMPNAVSTASLHQPAETITSTGSMMEFLGPNLGSHLPFSADRMTSRIPSPHPGPANGQWDFGLAQPAENEQMLKHLDDLIAATSGANVPAIPNGTQGPDTTDEPDTSWMMEDETLPPLGADSLPNDLVMDDLSFDDLTFGGAYDAGAGHGFN
ncbi:hypothetical protein KC347_g6890 [Hortaea werneckii]|nr:hypothetical protein KC347_g6890 [Hortaea werneckii]